MFFRAFPDVRFEGVGAPYLAFPIHRPAGNRAAAAGSRTPRPRAYGGTALALRWRMTATFAEDLALWGKRFDPTPPAFAPTGRRFDIQGVDFYEFRDGLVSRWTIVYDLFGLSRQLGLLPRTDSRMFPLMLRAQRLMAAGLRR